MRYVNDFGPNKDEDEAMEFLDTEKEFQDSNEEIVKRKKILIVDDQGFNIQALKVILKYSIGISDEESLEYAFNGQLALNQVKEDIE